MDIWPNVILGFQEQDKGLKRVRWFW